MGLKIGKSLVYFFGELHDLLIFLITAIVKGSYAVPEVQAALLNFLLNRIQL